MAERKLVNYEEAARFLGLTKGTLYSMVSRRSIPHHRIGKRLVRFDLEELKAWLDRLVVPEKENVMTEPKKPERDGTYVLVEIPPQQHSIYMVCKNSLVYDLTKEKDLIRFRYEDNTATVNVVNEVIEVTEVTDLKVLGIFETESESRKPFLMAACGEEAAKDILETERKVGGGSCHVVTSSRRGPADKEG